MAKRVRPERPKYSISRLQVLDNPVMFVASRPHEDGSDDFLYEYGERPGRTVDATERDHAVALRRRSRPGLSWATLRPPMSAERHVPGGRAPAPCAPPERR